MEAAKETARVGQQAKQRHLDQSVELEVAEREAGSGAQTDGPTDLGGTTNASSGHSSAPKRVYLGGGKQSGANLADPI